MELKVIREAVAFTTGVNEGLIRSLKRKTNSSIVMGTEVMTAKQIAIGLGRKYYPDLSWEELGWIIGTNDHVTAMHHHKQFTAFMDTEPVFIKLVYLSEQEYLKRIKSYQNLISKIPEILSYLDKIGDMLKKHQNNQI